MSKRLEGRDEPILDPDLPIVDAHHHLFDTPQLRYLLDEYLADATAGHKIVASVFVEAHAFYRPSGPEVLRPLGEIEFANGVGAMCAGGRYGGVRACAAIVGRADLRLGAGIGELLDRAEATAPERFRGIRQISMDHDSDAPFRYFFTGRPPSGLYQHPRFVEGLREIGRRGLVYDATGFHRALADIARFADACPDLTIVVDHMTVAMGLDMDEAARAALFQEWRAGLREAARRPNLLCKIGGLGMPFWGFGFDARPDPVGFAELAAAWRPFIETAVEVFGPTRCMMESNFPPDGRSAGFVPVLNALKHAVAGASRTEKLDLFRNTAARVYRIDLPAEAA